MSAVSDFERGVKEGRTDALLDEHTARLDAINGSIGRFSTTVEALAKNVREGLEKVSSAVRTLQEEGRLAEERVNVAAKTLAAEAERHRAELETTASGLAATAAALATSETKSDRKFSKREKVLSLVVAIAVPAASIYFGLH